MSDSRSTPTKSPCIGVCELDTRKVCLGCSRTIEEIVGWIDMDESQKRAVVERTLPESGPGEGARQS